MVTGGFFNSIDRDRLYDATQFGSIFDGIVRDGIFMSIGTCFRVVQDEEMTVHVGIGRAWFNHTWILNDSLLPIQIPQSEILLNRIDAIVIDIDNTPGVRANTIQVIKGTPATNPARPTLVRSHSHNQYPIAYVYVGQRVTEIRQANITNMVGTSETPFVTGILETVNIDMLVAQWGDQWREFFENQTTDMEQTNQKWKDQWNTWFVTQSELMQNTFRAWITEWEIFRDTYQNEMEEYDILWRKRWEQWFFNYTNDNSKDIMDWKNKIQSEFTSWWDDLKNILDENCCSQLTQAVLDLSQRVTELEKFKYYLEYYYTIWSPIYDNGYNLHEPLQDSKGNKLQDNDGGILNSSLWTEEMIVDSDGRNIEFRRLLQEIVDDPPPAVDQNE